MDRWTRIVDRLIGEIIGNGDISHLPGAGKPLALHDDCHTPIEQRTAIKIMQDHDVLPEWITSGKALERNEASLRKEIEARAQRYLHALHTFKRDLKATQMGKTKAEWLRFTADFCERVDTHNRDVLLHNLKVPGGIRHQPILSGEDLIKHALK